MKLRGLQSLVLIETLVKHGLLLTSKPCAKIKIKSCVDIAVLYIKGWQIVESRVLNDELMKDA